MKAEGNMPELCAQSTKKETEHKIGEITRKTKKQKNREKKRGIHECTKRLFIFSFHQIGNNFTEHI